MIILKSQSQVRSFIKRHKLNYKNSRGTDGVNVWGVKYSVLQWENKVIRTELTYGSGERDWHTYSVLAIIKIKSQ